MVRGSCHEGGKEHYWRGVLLHWQRSGQRVRSYCLQHGVSEPSFYAWRRTIQERDRQATRRPQRRLGTADGLPAFVPVTVAAAPPSLEVVLDDSRTIRVPAGFDAATLRRLLAVLDEAASC